MLDSAWTPEEIGCYLSPYPSVQRWLANIKKLPSWDKVNEHFYGLREAIKAQTFVGI
jgi:hypothetical protein